MILDSVQELEDAEKAREVFQSLEVKDALDVLVKFVIRAAEQLSKYYQSKTSKWVKPMCAIVFNGICRNVLQRGCSSDE